MTARQIVEKLGGSAKVARDLGVSSQAVYKWFQRDQIPEAMSWRMLDRYGNLIDRETLGLPPKGK